MLNLQSDGRTPNSRLPVLLYRDLPLQGDRAEAFETLFAAHLWPPRWRYDIYDFHHYHSTAHEVLGVAKGFAKVRLGGEHGVDVDLKAGDAVVLPAGIGHRQLDASDDFMVVGAYPPDQEPDLLRPEHDDHDAAQARIAELAIPVSDPVSGTQGRLVQVWRDAAGQSQSMKLT
jgi:uncharacterized protein YjlB